MPEFKVLGNYHRCNNWLPTPERDRKDLVIQCVCGKVFYCSANEHWYEYGRSVVDSIDGQDITWLDDL